MGPEFELVDLHFRVEPITKISTVTVSNEVNALNIASPGAAALASGSVTVNTLQ
jgi:hypothetical protein